MTLTRQEIFDKAWTGLKGQGFVQSLECGGCMYRGDNGLRCAIGHIIPDSRYDEGLEGLWAGHPKVRRAASIHIRSGTFASILQDCHDHYPTPANMERALRDFARDHNLTIPGEA